MIVTSTLGQNTLLDAVEDMRAQTSLEALWAQMNVWLTAYGITGTVFGTEALPAPGREYARLLNSIPGFWLEDKLRENLFYCDEYVNMSRTETDPILWSDSSQVERLTHTSRRALDFDHDYGIVTGVTLPVSFKQDMAKSSFGCHAQGMSWPEFDRIWAGWGGEIRVITHAFHGRLREACIGELFPLTIPERDLLTRLARGASRAQVAAAMGLTETGFARLLKSAETKLNAANATQAIATALIFDLITP